MQLNLRQFIIKAAEENEDDYNLSIIKDPQAYKQAQSLFKLIDPDEKLLGKYPSFLIKLDKLLGQYVSGEPDNSEEEDTDGANNNDDDDDEDDNEDDEDDNDDNDEDNDDDDDDDDDDDRDEDDDTDDEDDDDDDDE